jgi:quercetin dioxygenase-like cupin family protein
VAEEGRWNRLADRTLKFGLQTESLQFGLQGLSRGQPNDRATATDRAGGCATRRGHGDFGCRRSASSTRRGERHRAGSAEVLIRATGEDTNGSLFSPSRRIAPGFPGPPHERQHDMFCVLEGILTMRLEDDTHEVGAGTFICVTPGVVHTFSNRSNSSVRFLNFNSPSGWENHMRDVGEAAKPGPLTQDVIGRVAGRYDSQTI